MDRMVRPEVALATNREGWNRVASRFHGSTALPEYGPLAPTEDSLRLLDSTSDLRALELGCGSGHSLLFLANRGAQALWGIDLSPVQIAFAKETLRPFAPRVRLLESPMEVNPGVPENYFDLVFSIYGLGWTTDLPATMALVSRYLRPGGCFVLSGEHPAYSCLDWNGTQHFVAVPYLAEGPRAHTSWKGTPIVTHHRTLGTFIGEVIRAGLQMEALVEPPVDPTTVKEEHVDPSRWYSVARAQMMPTTFIIKARKPIRS
ncbi:MAG: methyltransferase domain-containing protein [Luteitalea sp.]|nr:methyltransferase domain-containing protein [Luteitalea sp.]